MPKLFKFLPFKLSKIKQWQKILIVLILVSLITTCSFGLARQSSSVVSTSSTMSSVSTSSSVASTTDNQIRIISVEVETLPRRTSYTPVDVVSTLGGVLRIVYSDYKVKYVPMNDSMIDLTRFDISTVGVRPITLRYVEEDQSFNVSYNINVVPFVVPLKNVNLNIADSILIIGNTFQLNLVIEPLNASFNRVVWSSSNSFIASVDQEGNVTGNNIGKAIISADVDGKFLSFSNIEIVAKPIIESPLISQPEPDEEQNLGVDYYVNIGYIPIASAAELNFIRAETSGERVFTRGTINTNDDVVFVFDADVSSVNNALRQNYVLVDNIDLSSFSSDLGWTPIGTNSDPYRGIFEGRDKEIENISINRPEESFIGLFGGIADDAEVNRLTISVNSIVGLNNVGALSGIITPSVLVYKVNVRLADGLASNTIAIDALGNVGGLAGNHAINQSPLGSTPFVFTLGEDGKYHYSNELGRILPHTLSSDDFGVIDSKLLTQQSDGKYYLSIAQEYNEISYADEVNLFIFEHEPNHEIVLSSRREDEERLETLVRLIPNDYKPILNAIDSKGNDVTNVLLNQDNLWTPYESFENGYYEYFELSLGNFQDAEYVQLLYSSVRDYTLDFENMFIMQVYNDKQEWIDASIYDANLRSSNVRRPISYPRLTLLDLTLVYNKIGRPADFRIKFGFNRVSYDYFAVSTNKVSNDFTMIKYSPSTAELNYRGFSSYTEDLTYKVFNYHETSNTTHGFYQNQSGYFTKYGDVKPLLSQKDNRFAIIRYGDELKFSFEAPFVTNNKVRSYVLGGSIWFKHVIRPKGSTVEPIPFQGMSAYPHTENSIIDQNYVLEWNTRYYPPINTSKNTIEESSVNLNVRGIQNVGGLVGYNEGNIIKSTVTGNVLTIISPDPNIHSNENIGGLIGLGFESTITDAEFRGNILASQTHNNVGGLVGYSRDSIITGSTIQVNQIEGDNSVGGIAGRGFNLIVSNSSVTIDDKLEGRYDVGGLVGYLEVGIISSNSIEISNLSTLNGYQNVGGIIGFMYNVEFYDNNINLLGHILAHSYLGGLIGYSSDSYVYDSTVIAGPSNLILSEFDSGAYFIGGAIGQSGRDRVENISIQNTLNIVGNDYTGGLIGYVSESYVFADSTNIINVNITGRYYVGGLTGVYSRTDINIVEVTPNRDYPLNSKTLPFLYQITNYQVNGSIEAMSFVGGLLGTMITNFDFNLINNQANVSITGLPDSEDVGGLIGQAYMNGPIPKLTISNSNSLGNVSGTSNVGSFIGALEVYDPNTQFEAINSSGSGSVNLVPADANNQIGNIIVLS